ncbi:GlxA family transcriptional regulator [Defluviimonas sp. WL0024]|uniref:GlxA family transcriptional regulator n=2 Tax=Albidovulum TaxID=205889 RepID=A0ABT3JAG5_9RHOB|nr:MULTISPECIES: GlxA family transcriptional regulator [Defluviimonas]MCU9850448.1 GlxA family transcriptional regulator [Defluviimonas sp. WL0024]MCW3784697.1 GlxA family transcriptional regulator [Defluviimonas salinarum]
MKPLNVTILLFDGFSNMVLACLLEPLRAVRDQVRGGITWSVITPGDRPAISSSGLSIAPDRPLAGVGRADLMIVISGYGFREHATKASSALLVRLGRQADLILGADTAAWLLAEAGLLAGRTATLHWQVLSDFAETFPDTQLSYARFVKEGRVWTCGGASTALDLMLAFIGERFGPALAFDVSTMFVLDAERQGSAGRGPNRLSGKGSAALRRVLNHMIETIEAPVPLEALAAKANLTPRTLNRLFLSELGMPPGRYHQFLRLSRARDLAVNTDLSQREIALRCGFSDAAALGKAFTRHFGYSIGKNRT